MTMNEIKEYQDLINHGRYLRHAARYGDADSKQLDATADDLEYWMACDDTETETEVSISENEAVTSLIQDLRDLARG